MLISYATRKNSGAIRLMLSAWLTRTLPIRLATRAFSHTADVAPHEDTKMLTWAAIITALSGYLFRQPVEKRLPGMV
jgi:hypothetical protein